MPKRSMAVFLILFAMGANAQIGMRNSLIIPGSGAGGITLGMSAGDVFRIMGDPPHTGTTDDFPGAIVYYYDGLGVAVQRSNVVQFLVTGSQYATGNGIGVGVSELRVKAMMGEPNRVGRYKKGSCTGRISGYQYSGIWLHFDCDGHVTEIRIP
jgi:hypothetical protein